MKRIKLCIEYQIKRQKCSKCTIHGEQMGRGGSAVERMTGDMRYRVLILVTI